MILSNARLKREQRDLIKEYRKLIFAASKDPEKREYAIIAERHLAEVKIATTHLFNLLEVIK